MCHCETKIKRMERQNFEDSLRAFQRRRPFQPFTVELMIGEIIEVDHPEALVIRGGIALFISSRNIPSIIDHDSVTRIVGETQRV